ncbi:MAG: twin-arginine translocation signal domain-containing protein [Ferruginibacter sp.]
MEKENMGDASPRRRFLQTLATGTAAIGMASIAGPFQQLHAETVNDFSMTAPPDEWFDKLNGKKHKMVFDATGPHGIMPFAWPKVFMITNAATGTPEKECGVVVVLRHDAIPYAMESSLWEKYHFGELFKADDPLTKKPSVRNPFWKPKPGDFKIPGVGNVEIGINELQDNGVMFCVCNMAMTVYSNVAAGQMNMQASDVMAEWKKGILPGIEIVPSGVWALGRAQEKGCAYCSVAP